MSHSLLYSSQIVQTRATPAVALLGSGARSCDMTSGSALPRSRLLGRTPPREAPRPDAAPASGAAVAPEGRAELNS